MFAAGRFARARGNSMFARAFNNELPRVLRMNMNASFIKMADFGEKPMLTGFAEQQTVCFAGCFAGFEDTSDDELLESEDDSEDKGIINISYLFNSLSCWSTMLTNQHYHTQ
jgi:hypothetical protein